MRPVVMSRRRLLSGLGLALAGALVSACAPAPAPTPTPAPTQAKPAEAPKPAAAPKPGTAGVTITYWNGLTGADGPVMDQLIERFTKETGIRVEQQRIPWADLYAKLQVSVPAGEGPDLCLIHTTEIPHFANDGILEPMDDKIVAEKGFRAEDYIKAPWEGGIFQGKRYAIPLDVPQHVLYMNDKIFKDAGLVGSDGKPKPPTTKDEVLQLAKQLTKGEIFGFAFGTPGYVWAFHNLLWQNDTDVFTPDFKKAAVNEPAGVEVAEFWGSIHAKLKIAPPGGVNQRDAFLAHKIAMWIAGSWNFTGLRDAKFEFTAGHVPNFFKKPVVWTIPHQYTFPKPKTKDDAKREAAWTHILWIRDNVAEWTLRAGQVSAYRKPHDDPRINADPALKVFLSQAPDWRNGQPTPKWTRAETITGPVLEKVYLGQMSPKDAMDDLARQINAIPD